MMVNSESLQVQSFYYKILLCSTIYIQGQAMHLLKVTTPLSRYTGITVLLLRMIVDLPYMF